MSERLKQLYHEMHEHTRDECAGKNEGCRAPRSCCDAMYCMMAEMSAKELWDEDLSAKRTGHESLPFMGPDGCVLEPHLRPACALHACCINGIGAKIRGEGAGEWTRRYFEIREQIEFEEIALLEKKGKLQ